MGVQNGERQVAPDQLRPWDTPQDFRAGDGGDRRR